MAKSIFAEAMVLSAGSVTVPVSSPVKIVWAGSMAAVPKIHDKRNFRRVKAVNML
jgi:hypothetical protein